MNTKVEILNKPEKQTLVNFEHVKSICGIYKCYTTHYESIRIINYNGTLFFTNENMSSLFVAVPEKNEWHNHSFYPVNEKIVVTFNN